MGGLVEDALEWAERYADKQVGWKDLSVRRVPLVAAVEYLFRHRSRGHDRFAAKAAEAATRRSVADIEDVLEAACAAAGHHAFKGFGKSKVAEHEAADQCGVIRDIFGNPFRPVTFDPGWRTEPAVALARRMYDAREFAAMPVLADALEDAGCDHPDILAHCRDPQGVHVRGCWAVDLVLGKA